MRLFSTFGAGGAFVLPVACAALLLSGCEPRGEDAGSNEEVVGEASALRDAAEMLDEREPPAAGPTTSSASADDGN